MADSITLDDVTQADFDTAEALIISMLREKYPELDLRKGTALRELQVRPEAIIAALHSKQAEQLSNLMSLTTISNESGVTATDVNAILANFNMTLKEGSSASGSVRVVVDTSREYTVPAGFTFSTLAGLEFTTAATVTVSPTPSAGETELVYSDGQYWFVLDVTAADSGAQYNVAELTNLSIISYLYGALTAETYTNFTGGTSGEAIADAITRIPSALSHRGLVNAAAIRGQLTDRFLGEFTINSVSVQGMGDDAMVRDRHNVFGVSTGGRCDIYPRTFTALETVTLTKTGTRDSSGNYIITIDADDAPGYYSVRLLTDADATGISSYTFTETLSASGITASWHDIEADEVAGTTFQASTLTVSGVVGEATHDFRVELYVTPYLADIQDYVDEDEIRPVNADFIVRCPRICIVSVNANVYFTSGGSVNTDQIRDNVVDYINSRSFVSRLTRSELANVILTGGASRVDLTSNGMELAGSVRGIDGTWTDISGDALDINSAADKDKLITKDTWVFATEPQKILLNGVVE